MAGICRPNIKNLGKEAKYRVLYSHSNGETTNKCGLFDGSNPNEWNTDNVFYWYNDLDLLEIEILDKCNIWRSGTESWVSYKNPLKILKFENNKYIDITSKIEQVTSEIDNHSWEKTISNLDKGRYKFIYDKGLRIDSEWYLEKVKESRYLLKQDNQYYSIKSEFYDKEKRTYLPCERDFDKNGIDDLHQLTTNIEINNEVFNPIMKFKGEIELIQSEEK